MLSAFGTGNPGRKVMCVTALAPIPAHTWTSCGEARTNTVKKVPVQVSAALLLLAMYEFSVSSVFLGRNCC